MWSLLGIYIYVKITAITAFCISLVLRNYLSAMVDFKMKVVDKWFVQKTNVSGVPLQNGDFIFYLDNYEQRQLVMTSNSGQVLATGYLMQPDKNWMEPSLWTRSDDFTIANFYGIEGI